MNKKPLDSLLLENQELRSRLDEAEDALRAIRSGEVDALVVYRPEGEQIYTLQGDDYPYRVMVESISEGAASLTKDGTLLFCNSRLAKMLDVPLETLPGSHLKRFFHQKDAGLIERLLEESLQGSSRAEVAFQRQDGESLPVLLALSPILMEDSWGRVMIATDLTTQKRDEEMVAAELLARSVLDQAAQAIVVCDSSGTVIRASQAAAKITGSTPLLHPFDKAFPLVYEKSQDGQDPFSIQAVLLGEEFHGVQAWYTIHQYGMPIYLLVNAVPLRNPSFEIIGCVVTLIDLTERKQAEIALQQANTQLRFFLENITDAYTEFDEMWRWVSINPVAERTIFQGRTAQELIGKVLWDEYPELVGGRPTSAFSRLLLKASRFTLIRIC